MADFKFDPMALNAPDKEPEIKERESFTFNPDVIKPDIAAPIEDAIHINPDDYAKNLDLSKRSGLPTSTIEQDQKTVENQVKTKQIRNSLDKHKFTATWVSEGDNARIAHDDVENLTALEAIANAWDRGILRVQQGGHQFMAEEATEMFQDKNRSFGQIYHDEVGGVFTPLDPLLAAERYITSRFSDDKKALAAAKQSLEAVAQKGREMQAKEKSAPATRSMEAIMKGSKEDGFVGALRAVARDPLGAAALSAEVGIEFGPQLIAGAVTTLVTGPVGGAVTMGTLSGLTERYASPVEFLSSHGVDLNDPGAIEKIIKDPVLMAKAKEFGFTRGMIIGSIDALSGGVASKTFGGPVKTMSTQMGIQAGMGGGGEALAQVATTGEIDPGEVVLEALGEFATAPLEVVGVGGQYIYDLKQSKNAKKYSESLKAMLAQESNLRERSPEKYAEFQGKLLRENGVEQISISGEGFSEFNQSGGDTSWIEKLGLSESGKLEMFEAMDGDIELTPEQYSLIPPEIAEQLRKHTRINDGMTEAEAEVFEETGMQDEFERISESFKEELDPEQQHDVGLIQQKIEDQLQAAGESSETSSYYGILMAQRYMTRAQRSGQNALELYMKDNLNITQDGQVKQTVDDVTISLDKMRSGKSAEDFLGLSKRPVIDNIISRGGIEPGSFLAKELEARGVRKENAKGLFKKGGLIGGDNIPVSEIPFFAGLGVSEDQNGFIDPEAIIDAIEREVGGEPSHTAGELTDVAAFYGDVENLQAQMAELGLSLTDTDEEIKAALSGRTFEQFAESQTEKINITKEDPIFSIPTKELKNKEIKVQDEDGAAHNIKAVKAVTIMCQKLNQVTALVDCVNAG